MPPAPGYGGYGGEQPYSIGEGFTWAWNKFSKNAGALIVATLVYGADRRSSVRNLVWALLSLWLPIP